MKDSGMSGQSPESTAQEKQGQECKARQGTAQRKCLLHSDSLHTISLFMYSYQNVQDAQMDVRKIIVITNNGAFHFY